MKNDYNKVLKTVIFAQCFGLLSMLLFMSGFILKYLTVLNISDSTALILLSLPHWAKLLLNIPAAYFSDKFSKKLIGNIGHVIMIIGFLLIACLPFAPENLLIAFAVTSIFLFGIGSCLFGSNWFALLNPSIPKEKRGHFFGIMRFSWQSTSIVVGLMISSFLAFRDKISSYQIVIFIIFFGLLARTYFYQKIPEKKTDDAVAKFNVAFTDVIHTKDFLPFLSYVFLLIFFTCAVPSIFVLLGKDVLNYSASNIINIGNAMGIGAACGFLLGGKIIDKIGTKKVFVICHLSYALVLSSFLFRHFIEIDFFVLGLFVSFAFGVVSATSGIAITSEMMELLPEKNQSLATSFFVTAMAAAFAIALPVVGLFFDLKIFNENWTLFGNTLTQYDSVLLLASCMILMLIITLSVIPSVMKKSIWVPLRQGR